MITVKRAEKLLLPISHRPNFALGVTSYFTAPHEAAIRFTMNVPNTYRPEDPDNLLRLEMLEPVPREIRTREEFYDWCLAGLMWMDLHECQEWFKVDGVAWRNPHGSPYAGSASPEIEDLYQRVREKYGARP